DDHGVERPPDRHARRRDQAAEGGGREADRVPARSQDAGDRTALRVSARRSVGVVRRAGRQPVQEGAVRARARAAAGRAGARRRGRAQPDDAVVARREALVALPARPTQNIAKPRSPEAAPPEIVWWVRDAGNRLRKPSSAGVPWGLWGLAPISDLNGVAM